MTEATTWILPEPGPEVTAVRDSDGDIWHRDAEQPDLWFANIPGGVETPWGSLLSDHGPLTDVTAEEGLS